MNVIDQIKVVGLQQLLIGAFWHIKSELKGVLMPI